jgi:arginyl-tRNA synthetase
LDEIVLARGDGTLVIYAQTLGVDIARYELGEFTDLLTVNGDQWKDGHKIIDTILCRLGYTWAADIERIYYGMVHTTAGVMSSRRGQAILIDRLLDETEAALAKRRAGPGGDEADIPALTLGVVKHALLRAPYAKTFTFDPDGLFAEPYDEYLAMLAGIRPDLASPAPSPPARGRDKSARLAMLDLAAFPTLVDKAAADRDPTRLSRFLRALTAELAAAEGTLDEPVVRAAGTVLRRGLGVLNIDTPSAYR